MRGRRETCPGHRIRPCDAAIRVSWTPSLAVRTIIPPAHQPTSSPALCSGKAEPDACPRAQAAPGRGPSPATPPAACQEHPPAAWGRFCSPFSSHTLRGATGLNQPPPCLPSLILLLVSTRPEGDISFAQTSRTTQAIGVLGLKAQELPL